jgi:hypothetical protein
VKRRGQSILAVVDGMLYFISLNAAALHYFDASMMEFRTIAGSAVKS